MTKKQTTGERIAAGFCWDHFVGSLHGQGVPDSSKPCDPQKCIARRIDSALKRAVREGYDAGWEDGMSHGTNAQNDGWNKLAKKYGMRGVE